MKLFVLCAIFASSFALDSATVDSAKADILDYLRNGGSPQKAVRLIFHDCVSSQCDGCLNLDNDSNAGLDGIVSDLDQLFVGIYDSEMSRADFWALAAIKSLELTAQRANGGSCTFGNCPVINLPDITFQYGRINCSTSPSTTDMNEFPDASWDRETLMTYFSEHFGFTTDEVVALSGAHTLGGNNLGNSGYRGDFVEGERSLLNTQYYKDMLDTSITWTNEFLVKTSKWQFGSLNSAGTDIGTRLNTDLELLYDLTINNSTGECSCTVGSDCEIVTDSYDLVQTYADDADVWAIDFVAIMEKLMRTGYDSLSDL